MVRAEAPRGKYAGVHVGRVVVRPSGWFDLKHNATSERFGVNSKYCHPLQRADGYSYAIGQPLVAAFAGRAT